MKIGLFGLLFISQIVISQNYNVPKNEIALKKDGYFYAYNQGRKVCNWIGYTITNADVVGNEPPLILFHKDDSIVNCASPSDYVGYSYSMGSLKPRSAARNSANEMNAVHNMLNVAPMNMAFKKGAWRILDNMIAGWAVTFDSVFVITGPIYDLLEPKMIGDGRVNVPDKFFKVVLVRNGLDLGAIGFIIPNSNKANNLQQYSMSIDSVEKYVGYNFFADLPEYLEGFTEEAINTDLWKDQSVSFKLKSAFNRNSQCIAAEKTDERCTTQTDCVTQNCWKHGCDLKK